MQIPWTTTPQGFTTQIVADLYKVECQTSLDYRPFLEADEVHVSVLFVMKSMAARHFILNIINLAVLASGLSTSWRR